MNPLLKLVKADSKNVDFVSLVKLLDEELQRRDGTEHTFYKQFNKIENIKHVLVAFVSNRAVGCGAIKPFNENTMEVKRMFVLTEMRGKGIAGEILKELENWSKELGYSNTILETGKKQPEAIRLYEKNKYTIIPNYGQYVGIENSVCMIKTLP